VFGDAVHESGKRFFGLPITPNSGGRCGKEKMSNRPHVDLPNADISVPVCDNLQRSSMPCRAAHRRSQAKRSASGQKINLNFLVRFFFKKPSILLGELFVMLAGSRPDSVEHSG
jgi:hypothetical protein